MHRRILAGLEVLGRNGSRRRNEQQQDTESREYKSGMAYSLQKRLAIGGVCAMTVQAVSPLTKLGGAPRHPDPRPDSPAFSVCKFAHRANLRDRLLTYGG
jgi:hypothetical protein